MVGFFKVHRGWRDCPVLSGEYSRADAWLWLIEHAQWKKTRAKIKGAVVDLDRGDLTFSQRFLAEKWGWSKSRVDRFMADLRAEGMISTRSKIGASADHKAGQGQSIITICNYEKYQAVDIDERGNVEPQSGASAGQQRGKEEEGKEINNPGDPAKTFWESALGYLGQDKRSLIGKLSKDYGREAVATAITNAMLASPQPPDRAAYLIGILKRTAEKWEQPVC